MVPVSYTHLDGGVDGQRVPTHSRQRVAGLAPAAGTGRGNVDPVSYTHLDVYKRQDWDFGALRRHYQGWLTTDADFRYTVADFDNRCV